MTLKKIYPILSFFLIVSIVSCMDSKTVYYKLPENYNGVVFIEFDCPTEPALNMGNNSILVNIPESGIIRTSTSYNNFISYHSSKWQWGSGKLLDPTDKIVRGSHSGTFPTNNPPKISYNEKGQKIFTRSAGDYKYICFYVNKDITKTDWSELFDPNKLGSCNCDCMRDRLIRQ